ncbi:RNA-binding domain-containing protein, partial [Wilcoxina mikolae CBS 423.85]
MSLEMSAHTLSPEVTTSGPPGCTVYVRNLEESIKISTLKQSLQAIFSQYGAIVDIVAKRSLKAKGQAFVVFDSIQAAENAIREVQTFPLFNKPMVLAFARTRSDATVMREAGENSREFETHKRRRLAEKERKQAQLALESEQRPAPAPTDKVPRKSAGLKSTAPITAPQIPDEYLPPNTTLFLRDLPDDADSEMLLGLLGRFDAFKEVRMVPGRKGI